MTYTEPDDAASRHEIASVWWTNEIITRFNSAYSSLKLVRSVLERLNSALSTLDADENEIVDIPLAKVDPKKLSLNDRIDWRKMTIMRDDGIKVPLAEASSVDKRGILAIYNDVVVQQTSPSSTTD